MTPSLRRWLDDGDAFAACDLLWLRDRGVIAFDGGIDASVNEDTDRVVKLATPDRGQTPQDSKSDEGHRPRPDTTHEKSRESSGGNTATGTDPDQSRTPIRLEPGGTLHAPSPRALAEAAHIRRMLKPLRRKRGSIHEFELDESGTVELSAQIQTIMPLMRARRERWMDLTIVVDQSASMLLWRDALIELRKLCERIGAFRIVRMIRFDPQSATFSCWKLPERRSLLELRAHDGRSMLWLASTCVGPAWRSQVLQACLATLGEAQPVAILQLLPQRLWRRTALNPWHPSNEWARVGAEAPGVANARLKWRSGRTDVLNEPPHANAIAIPVLSLEGNLIREWARLMTAPGKTQLAAIIVSKSAVAVDVPAVPATPQAPAGPETPKRADAARAQVANFMSEASPTARELARMLAHVPLRLPIVRLIQRTLQSGRSENAELAEIFMSGMVRRLSPKEETEPDRIDYDFLDGVREALLEQSSTSQLFDVHRVLGDYIAARLGRPFDFLAALTQRDAVDKLPDYLQRVFATVRTSTLARLGLLDAPAVKLVAPHSVFKGKCILWVDDFPLNNVQHISRLRSLGATVTEAASTSKAVELLESQNWDALITDMGRVGDEILAGLQLLDIVDQRWQRLPCFVLSRQADRFAQQCASHGAIAASSEWKDIEVAMERQWESGKTYLHPIWPAATLERTSDFLGGEGYIPFELLRDLAAKPPSVEVPGSALEWFAAWSGTEHAGLIAELTCALVVELHVGRRRYQAQGTPAAHSDLGSTKITDIAGIRTRNRVRLIDMPAKLLTTRQSQWISAWLDTVRKPARAGNDLIKLSDVIAEPGIVRFQNALELAHLSRHFFVRSLASDNRSSPKYWKLLDDLTSVELSVRADIRNQGEVRTDSRIWGNAYLNQIAERFLKDDYSRSNDWKLALAFYLASATKRHTVQKDLGHRALKLVEAIDSLALTVKRSDLNKAVGSVHTPWPSDVPPLHWILLTDHNTDLNIDSKMCEALAYVLAASGIGIAFHRKYSSRRVASIVDRYHDMFARRTRNTRVVELGTEFSFSRRETKPKLSAWISLSLPSLDGHNEYDDFGNLTVIAIEMTGASMHLIADGSTFYSYRASRLTEGMLVWNGWYALTGIPELVRCAVPSHKRIYLSDDTKPNNLTALLQPSLKSEGYSISDRPLRVSGNILIAPFATLAGPPASLLRAVTGMSHVILLTTRSDDPSLLRKYRGPPFSLIGMDTYGRDVQLLMTELHQSLTRHPDTDDSPESRSSHRRTLSVEVSRLDPKESVDADTRNASHNSRYLASSSPSARHDVPSFLAQFRITGEPGWPMLGEFDLLLPHGFEKKAVRMVIADGIAKCSVIAQDAFDVKAVCDWGATQLSCSVVPPID
jgi:CheY-like chemotaxis protein